MNQNGVPIRAISRVSFFVKREMAELPNLLMVGERVLAIITGFYTAGTAILCVTSKRLLLVDKKLMRLSIEDVRFESIKEVNYSHQAIMASVKFYYAGRFLQFRSWHRKELRMVSQLVQQKMFDVREQPQQMRQEPVDDTTSQTPELKSYSSGAPLENYLSEKFAQWRRANRLADMLAFSSKAGRRILELEASKR